MEEEFKKSLENAAAQMRKGVLEFAILLVIAKKKNLCQRDYFSAERSETNSCRRHGLPPALPTQECRTIRL